MSFKCHRCGGGRKSRGFAALRPWLRWLADSLDVRAKRRRRFAGPALNQRLQRRLRRRTVVPLALITVPGQRSGIPFQKRFVNPARK
jgi:hypothetical protein